MSEEKKDGFSENEEMFSEYGEIIDDEDMLDPVSLDTGIAIKRDNSDVRHAAEEGGPISKFTAEEQKDMDDYGYDDEVYSEYGGYTNSIGPANFSIGADYKPSGPSDPGLQAILANMRAGKPVEQMAVADASKFKLESDGDFINYSGDTAFSEYGGDLEDAGNGTFREAKSGASAASFDQPAPAVEQREIPAPESSELAPRPVAAESEAPRVAASGAGYTPVQAVGKKSRKKLSYVLLAVIALLLGFGGGLLACGIMADRLDQNVRESFGEMLEEAGGIVLYRSVDTQQNMVEGGISVSAITEQCADSVVEISTTVPVTRWGFFGPSSTIQQGAGSGIIISDSGYILTCYHVTKNAQTITVGLRNGNSYEGTLVAGDEESDVAVVKIETDEELTVAVLGDSSQMKVGDPVVAIGNPLGQLGGTVTSGILSATDREITFENGTFNVLQTDAAINGGNSGGGLFNAKGELIGIVNGKAESIGVEGLAFALPMDDIKPVIEDLLNFGYVTDQGAKLGVVMVDILDDRTATSYRVDELGCYILQVSDDSNASFAGLESGDRIVSIDGTAIKNADQVVDIISGHKVNDVIKMVVERAGQEKTFNITLYAKLPEGGNSTI